MGPGAEGYDTEAPLDEYYYSRERLEVMRKIQESSLDVPFASDELPGLVAALTERMELTSPSLIPHLGMLEGKTYAELFGAALGVISADRQPTAEPGWLGFNENWAVEFFAPLARSFLDARFIVIVRDVRASVASQRALEDPALVALTMSFVRCWRKMIAFARHYQGLALFDGRLRVVRYEELVAEPEETARGLCKFLDVDFAPEMLDTGNFAGRGDSTWTPNSSFEVPARGIYTDSLERWRKMLPPDMVHLIELAAGPDLEFAGYALSEPSDGGIPWDAYRCHIREHAECRGWRTDREDPAADFALELLRRRCLGDFVEDDAIVEECFLFRDVYQDMRDGQQLSSTPGGKMGVRGGS
ncbi:sulfotransferase, partial [Verrucomicrobiota bacterium]